MPVLPSVVSKSDVLILAFLTYFGPSSVIIGRNIAAEVKPLIEAPQPRRFLTRQQKHASVGCGHWSSAFHVKILSHILSSPIATAYLPYGLAFLTERNYDLGSHRRTPFPDPPPSRPSEVIVLSIL